MTNFVKDNGGILTVMVFLYALSMGFLEWRAQVHAQDYIAEKTAGIVAPEKIEAMDDNIQENEESIEAMEDRWNRLVDAIAAQ